LSGNGNSAYQRRAGQSYQSVNAPSGIVHCDALKDSWKFQDKEIRMHRHAAAAGLAMLLMATGPVTPTGAATIVSAPHHGMGSHPASR
jgi:hypothetical protein